MLRAIGSRESRMREIRTYGLMRERAPHRPSLLYFKTSLFFRFPQTWRRSGTNSPLATTGFGNTLEAHPLDPATVGLFDRYDVPVDG
jgi:hypothetical protein